LKLHEIIARIIVYVLLPSLAGKTMCVAETMSGEYALRSEA
jgi:hypothetical protein